MRDGDRLGLRRRRREVLRRREDRVGAHRHRSAADGDHAGGRAQGGGSLDGISLVDNRNGKRYLVGRDDWGACVCDANLSSAFVKPGAPLLLSATFGAPPSDVDAVDVVIPRFGTFKDVPIS